MDNKTALAHQQLLTKLVTILLTGLASVLILGSLMYLQEHQASLATYGVLISASFLVCLVTYRLLNSQATNLKGVLRKAGHTLGTSGSRSFNAMLFATVMMSLLISMQSGALDTRQLFFLCLLSGVTGMMLATVWQSLALEKSKD